MKRGLTVFFFALVSLLWSVPPACASEAQASEDCTFFAFNSTGFELSPKLRKVLGRKQYIVTRGQARFELQAELVSAEPGFGRCGQGFCDDEGITEYPGLLTLQNVFIGRRVFIRYSVLDQGKIWMAGRSPQWISVRRTIQSFEDELLKRLPACPGSL